MRNALIAAAIAAVLVPAGQSQAFEMGGESFGSQQVFFHAGQTPVGTIDHQLGSEIPWSTQAPGDGIAATLGNNYSTFADFVEDGQREASTFVAEGTFTGNLETIAVDLWYTGPAAGVCQMSLAFQVYIDGAEILWQEQAAPSANLKEEAGPYRGTRRVRFMFSNIHDTMLLYGVPTGPELEHEIYLNFANFYACNEAVWLYDSTTFPSGMIFNLDPSSAEAQRYTKVDVQNPPPPLA